MEIATLQSKRIEYFVTHDVQFSQKHLFQSTKQHVVGSLKFLQAKFYDLNFAKVWQQMQMGLCIGLRETIPHHRTQSKHPASSLSVGNGKSVDCCLVWYLDPIN